MHTPFINRALRATGATIAALLAGTAQAALQDRDLDGNGQTDAFYDTDLNITWLRDANVNGLMNGQEAKNWAADFSFGGYSDWRLPASDASCTNLNCTGSEMGHLYYVELGNPAGGPLSNSGGFQNLQSVYWSGTGGGIVQYYFQMANGVQYWAADYLRVYAMAVRDGDVPAVPEPGTYALMLAGLAGLALRRRSNASSRRA